MSQQPEDEQEHPLRRVSTRNFESIIDQQFRAAEAAGQFNNLAGAGKPQELDDDKDVPDELRVGFRMLKNAGYAPPWIELQKSISDERAALERWLVRMNQRWSRLGPGDRAALRTEYEQRLRELNQQISVYNLTAPPAAGQYPLLQIEPELAKLGAPTG